jgi:hypothetical protein
MAFKRSGVRFPSPPWLVGASVARQNRCSLRTEVDAGIAQLVEHNLAKVGVAGSSPVSRSESSCW